MEPNPEITPGLERSCEKLSGDWVRIAPSTDRDGPERIEARFLGEAYSPHRHDTYAIGLTLSGVQDFHYRGALRHSLPGNAIVLHPDEMHDGHAGIENGFRYRMIYIEPEAIGAALEQAGGALPFVEDGVKEDPALASALWSVLSDMENTIDPLEWSAAVADIADALARIDPSSPNARRTKPDITAVHAAKALMLENIEEGVGLDALEDATGQSRFALARHFRQVCGVSPHRWLVMRRLDRARAAMADGMPLAEAAMQAGFADQAHMTRHFKSAYGMTPGQWLSHRTRGELAGKSR